MKYDLIISFTPDGELSNHTGLDHLLDLSESGGDYFDVDFFLSLDGAQNYISTGKTGLIQFFITIKGQASHIARSFLGVNAVNLAIPLLVELKKLAEEISKRTSNIKVNPELPYRYVRPDLAITVINGGSSFERVPDQCLIQGHRLVVPAEGADPMAEAMDEIVSTIMGVKQKYQIPLEFRVVPAIPPFITSSDHPALRELAEIAAASAGLEKYPTHLFRRV
ncbi:MAG: peptidase dimerization domain-containing protein [bacterium]